MIFAIFLLELFLIIFFFLVGFFTKHKIFYIFSGLMMIVASAGIFTEGVQDPLVSSTRITEITGSITDVNNFRNNLTVDGAGHGQLLFWLQWTFFITGIILIVLSIILMFEGQVKGLVGRFFK
jgi:hypothetical protein